MALAGFLKKWKSILFPTVCLILSGCGSFFPVYSAPALTSTSMIIHAGTQATFNCEDENISIASGTNYHFIEFMDEFGSKRKETACGLYFSMRGKQERARYYTAYAGLIIYYYSLKIEVLRIGVDLSAEFVEVEVGIVKQSGETDSCHHY